MQAMFCFLFHMIWPTDLHYSYTINAPLIASPFRNRNAIGDFRIFEVRSVELVSDQCDYHPCGKIIFGRATSITRAASAKALPA